MIEVSESIHRVIRIARERTVGKVLGQSIAVPIVGISRDNSFIIANFACPLKIPPPHP